jgi:hypothetical protein
MPSAKSANCGAGFQPASLSVASTFLSMCLPSGNLCIPADVFLSRQEFTHKLSSLQALVLIVPVTQASKWTLSNEAG